MPFRFQTDVQTSVGIYFRALGGDGGLQVTTANATEHGARRRWLQRFAGTGKTQDLAWRDEQTLRLPERIDWFSEIDLNRDLYLWLAALAVGDDKGTDETWFAKNQRLAFRTLEHLPGLEKRYRRLVAAHLDQRPNPAKLPADEAAREVAIQQALCQPGSCIFCPYRR